MHNKGLDTIYHQSSGEVLSDSDTAMLAARAADRDCHVALALAKVALCCQSNQSGRSIEELTSSWRVHNVIVDRAI